MNKIEKIVNCALTPTMRRTRSGTTQMFREDYNDRAFTSSENADVIIEPPERHWYAELIDNVWWWVNGCDICNGKPEKYGAYKRCDTHDDCYNCATKRSEIKGNTVWGHEQGFECVPCHEVRTQREKEEALEAMPSDEDFDSWDYHGLDDIKCPYCDNKWSDSWEYHDADDTELECDRCNNKFTVTAQHSLSFDCNRID